MSKIKAKIIWFLLLLIFIFSQSGQAFAASFYFSGNNTAKINDSITYGIYVSATEQAINAISSTIIFNPAFLEVTGINKGSSIISFWATEPSFSNTKGTINFDGVIMNPGYLGSSGKIITATFRVKKLGDTTLSFSESQILANNGEGTNVFTSAKTATLTTKEETKLPTGELPKTETPTLITAPLIYSDTHPDQTKPYNNNKPIINITPNTKATAIKIGVNQTPNEQPSVTYAPPIWQKELDELPDGKYFFSAQMKNTLGWGAVSEFQFEIDTKPPEIQEIIIDETTATTTSLKIKLVINEELENIDRFEIQINNQTPILLSPNDLINDQLEIRNIPKGEITIKAKVFDRANNFSEKEARTFIKISAPEILEYYQELFEGQKNIIVGQSLPNTNITIWLQKNSEYPVPFILKTEETGKFIFHSAKLEIGQYQLFTQLLLPESKETIYSEKINFNVIEKPPFFTKENIPFYFSISLSFINIILFIFLIIMIRKKRNYLKKIRENEPL